MRNLLLAIFMLVFSTNNVFAQIMPLDSKGKVLNVVASFSILGDMADQVGGSAVLVTTLVPPDSDAHAYQPTPADAKALNKADIILINGLGFEGWMTRLIKSSGTKAKIVVASNGVKPRMFSADEVDPHAWQNLANGSIYVKNIAAAFAQASPSQAKQIEARAVKYQSDIKHTDSFVKRAFSVVPAAKRKVITSHDAFGYFADAYGITFLAPLGLNTEAAPSAANVAKLITQIKTEHVKQIFIENMANPKLIQQIAHDSGAQMGGTLYSDALSGSNGSAATYLGMFQSNVVKLQSAMLLNGL